MSSLQINSSLLKLGSLVLFLSLGACASGAAQEKAEKFNSNAVPADKPGVAAGDCFEKALSNKSLKENCKIDTTVFALKLNGRTKTAIEILRSTGKKVAIFQLAGVQCSSCEEEAKHFASLISASSVGTQIAHIILFTDVQKEFSDAEFSAWVKSKAPKATRAHDEAGVLWDTLKNSSPTAVRAPVFTIDLNGNGAFNNVEGRVLEIFPVAEKLVKAGSANNTQSSSR